MIYRVIVRNGIRFVVRDLDRGANVPNPNWADQNVALCGILKRGQTLEEFTQNAKLREQIPPTMESKRALVKRMMDGAQVEGFAFDDLTKEQRELIYAIMEQYADSKLVRHIQYGHLRK